MKDRYLAALRQIEKSQKNQISVYEEGTNRLDALISGIGGQSMTVSDYIKIQEMYFQRYTSKASRKSPEQQSGLHKAQMYCLLQSQMVMAARSHPSLRRYFPCIAFQNPLDPELQIFLSRKRPFYQVLVAQFRTRWIVLATVSACILMSLLVLAAGIPFWTGWMLACAAAGLILWTGYRKVVPDMAAQRLASMRSKLDPVHARFEKQMLHPASAER